MNVEPGSLEVKAKAAVVRAGLNLLFDLDWTERASPEDREWWGTSWAGRATASSFA